MHLKVPATVRRKLMLRAAAMKMKEPWSSMRRTSEGELNEKQRSPQRWDRPFKFLQKKRKSSHQVHILTLSNTCQNHNKASPKRPKDTEAEGDSKVDGNKSNAEAKLNDVAGAKATAPSSQSESKAEAQDDAPAGGLTADKVGAPRSKTGLYWDIYGDLTQNEPLMSTFSDFSPLSLCSLWQTALNISSQKKTQEPLTLFSGIQASTRFPAGCQISVV